MDNTDFKILDELATNSRISGADIARKIHLSLPAVTERLRKLDKSGVIEQYTVRFNSEMLGLKLLAFVQVWLEHAGASKARLYLTELPEVLECHHIAGDYDLLLKVLVKDTGELEELLSNKIKGSPAVTRTSTTIVMSTYKEDINIRSK
ncbi:MULTISPECIES: Lrp/AsnC family transcriptional regulator [unclassified Imperialibacter]|uniref:Lrp/AsnC family transcriptional regulator n=1 Tax=unclassified Imperialibacter TaxID=2629706 RepID=UPI00125878A6|nr:MULTISPECIES: Lrp/AsnC family transcriptional regulator [unclassified Imperialibacter]CAD5252726.1 Transcriptional regulator [Imperialibacter sp. 89]CAD5260867.1 Transcriptional regulator [Imperialibacter sp. 75]VVT03892.1 Transcriptional regulator [Imperialibacter sp. EC-SDR9]